MLKAVIFDLDDTLISEQEYVYSGYNHVAEIISKKYSLNFHDTKKELIQLYTQGQVNVFNEFLKGYRISFTNDDILYLVYEYRNHKPEIKFYSDVLPTINYLKKLNIKTGIITDGYKITQNMKLSALGANEYFDNVIVTDELGREYWKPHEKPFIIMSEGLSVPFDRMMYVGDNPEKDFYISTVLPITCIRIYRKNTVYETRDYFNGIKEKYAIKSLRELCDNILNWSDCQETVK